MNPGTSHIGDFNSRFQGNTRNIDRIVETNPEVVSPGETVRRLTREVKFRQNMIKAWRFALLKEQGIKRDKSELCLD
jgi:lipoic acid synthetase